jgi:purine-binding chemotaxis protein CheW
MSQYLTFKLGTELYGVGLLDVQEIRGYSPVTPLPNAPPHFKGVMNLRGVIVPVVDLRSRFGLSSSQPNKLNVIVVVALQGRTSGLLVDSVADVIDVDESQLSGPPAVAGSMPTEFIRGVARVNEHLLIVLDLERIVSSTPISLAA